MDQNLSVETFANRSKTCLFIEVNMLVPFYVYIANTATLIVNSVLSPLSTLGNALVIVAICKSRSLHSPTNTLLCCLAFSDLLIGVVSQPSYAVYKHAENQGNFPVYCVSAVVMEMSGWTGLGVSLLTLTAISIERYIAFFSPLRYYSLVLTGRILKFVVCFWILMVCLGGFRLNRLLSNSSGSIVMIAIMLTCLIISTLAYAKIFRLANHHRARERHQSTISARFHGRNVRWSNNARQKRSLFTMAIVFGLFVLCYFPFLCCMAAFKILGFTTGVKVALNVSTTVAFTNSSLNPILYCYRIKGIRRGVWRMFSKNRVNVHTTRISTSHF